ncbi:hypothetical protein DICVIV_04091 [Dictyocaulus viviparus]|uniref:Protein sleepless n=1 Tax=Dictyocaulus viviparus TaxID=29172 RepID=A0A0D8Y5C3_DICVI|nr:hypothetical protein DICVIV_04091 [Dictyocaulus viviparus]
MLSCYHCVSQLRLEGIENDAKLALKELVFQRYHVPPSNEFCEDSNAYDFYTSDIQQCDDTDQCLKLSITQKDLLFVMRGCQSQLLRPGYYLSQETGCTNKGPSQCLCDTDLCNLSNCLNIFLSISIMYVVCELFI